MPVENMAFDMIAGNAALGAKATLVPASLGAGFGTGKGLALGLGFGLVLLAPVLAVGVGLAGWAGAGWIASCKQKARILAYQVGSA